MFVVVPVLYTAEDPLPLMSELFPTNIFHSVLNPFTAADVSKYKMVSMYVGDKRSISMKLFVINFT